MASLTDITRGAAFDISKAPNWPDLPTVSTNDSWTVYQNRYSIVNRNVFARYDAPTYFLTYAETVFLEAEAAVRGRTTEDPAALYESGVTAAMQIAKIASLEGSFPAATVPGISDAAINTYPAANPYNPGDALNPLNTQYWLNTYMDE